MAILPNAIVVIFFFSMIGVAHADILCAVARSSAGTTLSCVNMSTAILAQEYFSPSQLQWNSGRNTLCATVLHNNSLINSTCFSIGLSGDVLESKDWSSNFSCGEIIEAQLSVVQSKVCAALTGWDSGGDLLICYSCYEFQSGLLIVNRTEPPYLSGTSYLTKVLALDDYVNTYATIYGYDDDYDGSGNFFQLRRNSDTYHVRNYYTGSLDLTATSDEAQIAFLFPDRQPTSSRLYRFDSQAVSMQAINGRGSFVRYIPGTEITVVAVLNQTSNRTHLLFGNSSIALSKNATDLLKLEVTYGLACYLASSGTPASAFVACIFFTVTGDEISLGEEFTQSSTTSIIDFSLSPKDSHLAVARLSGSSILVEWKSQQGTWSKNININALQLFVHFSKSSDNVLF